VAAGAEPAVGAGRRACSSGRPIVRIRSARNRPRTSCSRCSPSCCCRRRWACFRRWGWQHSSPSSTGSAASLPKGAGGPDEQMRTDVGWVDEGWTDWSERWGEGLGSEAGAHKSCPNSGRTSSRHICHSDCTEPSTPPRRSRMRVCSSPGTRRRCQASRTPQTGSAAAATGSAAAARAEEQARSSACGPGVRRPRTRRHSQPYEQ